jgi:hypothetical protein
MPSDARTYWLYFGQKDPKQDAAFRALAHLSPGKRRQLLMRWVLLGRQRHLQLTKPRQIKKPLTSVPPPLPPQDDEDPMTRIRRGAVTSTDGFGGNILAGRKDRMS